MSSATSYVWVPLSRPVFMKKLGVDGQNSKHKTIWATTCPQSEKYQTSPRIMATEKRQRYIFYLCKTPVTFLPLRSFHSCSFSALKYISLATKTLIHGDMAKAISICLSFVLKKKKTLRRKKTTVHPEEGTDWSEWCFLLFGYLQLIIAWHAIYWL